MRVELGIGIAWGACLAGCMSGGVRFAGSRQPAVLSASAVESGSRPPASDRRLGKVDAECSPHDPASGFHEVRLSDLSCSVPLLRAALRETAARAGGTFLANLECRDSRSESGGTSRVTWRACEADVWGPDDPERFEAEASLAPAANATPAPGAPSLGSVAEAWRISIDFWPAPGRTPAGARSPGSVAEVDFPLAGQRPLGDVSAACDEGCSVDSLRRALRAATAGVGATTLVGVRCIRREEGAVCVGSVAVPEVDEEQVAGAR